MAFFGKGKKKDKKKIGTSSREHDEIRNYLSKVHDIENQLFDSVHNTLVVIDSIGIEEADEEITRLKEYAKKLSTLSDAEKAHLAEKPKKLYRLEKQALSLEHTVISLLQKIQKGLKGKDVPNILGETERLLDDLRKVVKEEEKLLKAS